MSNNKINETRPVKNLTKPFNNYEQNNSDRDDLPTNRHIRLADITTQITPKVISKLNVSFDRLVQKGISISLADHTAAVKLARSIIVECYAALRMSTQANTANLSMYAILMQIHDIVKIRSAQFQFADPMVAEYAINAIKYAVADTIFTSQSLFQKSVGLSIFNQRTQPTAQFSQKTAERVEPESPTFK